MDPIETWNINAEKIQWVRRKLVCEVKYAELTAGEVETPIIPFVFQKR